MRLNRRQPDLFESRRAYDRSLNERRWAMVDKFESAPDGSAFALEHRVGDKRIIRLIQKWLKAGITRRWGRDGR